MKVYRYANSVKPPLISSGGSSIWEVDCDELIGCFYCCRLLVTEQAGKACRDDSVEGLRFYPNFLVERTD